EFNHASVFTGSHYDFTSKLRAHVDGKVTRVGYATVDPMWTTRITVLDVGYAFDGFMNMGFSSMPMGLAVDGAFAMVKTDVNPAPPSVPEVVAGISYGGM